MARHPTGPDFHYFSVPFKTAAFELKLSRKRYEFFRRIFGKSDWDSELDEETKLLMFDSWLSGEADETEATATKFYRLFSSTKARDEKFRKSYLPRVIRKTSS